MGAVLSNLAKGLRAAKKPLVTLAQMQAGLDATDYSEYINKHATNGTNKMSVPKNDTCFTYHSWQSPPAGCPGGMWIKYDKMEFEHGGASGAGVSVDGNNHVGLTVTNVTMNLKPTSVTIQPHGFMTFPCTGVLKGVISGAAAAVEAAVNASAEGVPIIGEQAAMPVDGLVHKLEYQLDGLCGALEALLEDVLDIAGQLLQDVLGTDLPMIIQDLMAVIFGNAVTQPGLAAPELGCTGENGFCTSSAECCSSRCDGAHRCRPVY